MYLLRFPKYLNFGNAPVFQDQTRPRPGSGLWLRRTLKNVGEHVRDVPAPLLLWSLFGSAATFCLLNCLCSQVRRRTTKRTPLPEPQDEGKKEEQDKYVQKQVEEEPNQEENEEEDNEVEEEDLKRSEDGDDDQTSEKPESLRNRYK